MTGWPWTEESLRFPEKGPGAAAPRITIVTPSFNQGRFLEETIRSILLQGYPDLEYFVLDGGSTDNSVEIIRRYSRWIDFWVSEPDGGQSAAINRGLNMGSGLHATWINSDDMLCRNALVNHASAARCDGSVVYVDDCVYMDGADRMTSLHRARIHSFQDLMCVRDVWRTGGNLVQPEVLFPLKGAMAAGGLNIGNHYTMDYELWGKLLLAGYRFEYTEVPFGMFRRHREQKTHDSIRQTRSLIATAQELLAQANIPGETREETRRNLRAYEAEHARLSWLNSGRLARLGLPRSSVAQIRRFKVRLLNAIKAGGVRGD